MDKQEMALPKGLRGHRKKIELITYWCRDWISQDQFDALEHDAMWGPGNKILEGMSADDFMLSYHNPYGHLLWLLRAGGLIEAEKRNDGLLWYKAKPGGTLKDPRRRLSTITLVASGTAAQTELTFDELEHIIEAVSEGSPSETMSKAEEKLRGFLSAILRAA